MANREATIFFICLNIYLYRNGVENSGRKREKYCKCEKKYLIGTLSSPGRWTGNDIIFKGGLINDDTSSGCTLTTP